MGQGDGDLLVAHEGHPSGEALEGHRAEGVLVGPAVDLGPIDLLGGHVGGRAQEGAGAGQPGLGARLLGQPEVGQVGVRPLVGAGPVEEHVARLHVAVHEALGMGGIERPGDLAQELDRQRRRQRPVTQAAGEVGAIDVAHGQEEHPLDLAGLVKRDDVGMVDRRRQARLALEARPEVGVLRQLVGEELEGDLATELPLLREVDDAHAAAAQDPLDAIRPEVGAEARVGTGGGHGLKPKSGAFASHHS